MLVKELDWREKKSNDGEDIIFYAYTEHGRFTVLDRLTGWGDGDIRDTETGYKDTEGKFWLVSGMFDIRECPDLTISEAIELIKSQANTCKGI